MVELRYLQIFVELYRRRSVSRTAEALGINQPTVSVGLARLRTHYGDPLYVRSGQGMQPTARADALARPLAEALRLILEADYETPSFSPASTTRRFTIAVTDAGQMVVLPVILNFLESAGSDVTLDVRNIAADTPEALEAGEVELAFGYMRLRKRGLFQQVLFEDRFACIARREHPSIRSSLTKSAFETASHAVVASKGTSTELISRELERAGIQRKVKLVVPSYLGLAQIVATTNVIAIVPGRVAELLVREHAVRSFPVPIALSTYEVRQHWHRRHQHDEGHRWLRHSIVDLFQRWRTKSSAQ